MSVIGNSGRVPDEVDALAYKIGRLAVDAGFRVASGGLDGVMEAVSRGARESEAWTEGTVVGVLPSLDPDTANPYVDIVMPTGIGLARNALVVAIADVVVAVRGGTGTLSEIAFAWQFGKPVIGVTGLGGWSQELSGRTLDHRQDGIVEPAASAAEAIAKAKAALGL
jgi:uncharacterized protein (TIGR00725 family)